MTMDTLTFLRNIKCRIAGNSADTVVISNS
jgi:hypothetical protein